MRKIIIVIGLIFSNIASSDPLSTISKSSYWTDIQTNAETQLKQARGVVNSRSLILDEQGLREKLFGDSTPISSRPLLSTANGTSNSTLTEIDLPLPNSRFIRVSVIESSILSPDIAVQYPQIKTWRVVGIDNPDITGRIDITEKGFHGILSMPDGDTVFIDPDISDSTSLYHSLSKHDNAGHFNKNVDCKVHDKHSLLDDFDAKSLSAKKLSQKPAPDLITYRLAIAGTAEYTESQGGTPSAAFSSMVTTINRVNSIFQRDLGIKLQIINNDSLAYTNPLTDPYTNDDATALVHQNIQHINDTIGAENYDTGHVFAQGKLGGLSYVGAVCQDEYKAGSATGTPNPQGEIFSIEFVAHEMGHQLGATHSFNSSQKGCGGGNRTSETAVEPGSGSTIMSYAGLCGTDNLQQDSDAIFHWVSIAQINNYTRVKSGNSCGSKQSRAQNPTANAGVDSTIPKNTPFFLDGSSTNGNTFSWEQMDAGTTSAVDIDKADNAIIRVLPLSTSEDRYIPRLSDLFAGTRTKGEILPQTARDLNFVFVVRDRNGGIDSDLKEIQIKNTGGTFSVLSQSTSQTLYTKQNIRINWNVAGTNYSPISCSKVNIQLLRENGTKNILLENTDNDGIQQIAIPATTPIMTDARIMIECTSQPFFQISTGTIAIQKGTGSDPEEKEDNGSDQSSSGGSLGFLLFFLALIATRKEFTLSENI